MRIETELYCGDIKHVNAHSPPSESCRKNGGLWGEGNELIVIIATKQILLPVPLTKSQ